MRNFIRLFVSVVLLVQSTFVLAQERTITGTVLSGDDNKPMAGVTILNRNNNKTALTNEDGRFSIQAEKGHALVFSYVGYLSQEIKVGDGSNLNARMKATEGSLGEVVVTAHGISRNKKSLGYSTPTVSGKDVAETQREGFINGLMG